MTNWKALALSFALLSAPVLAAPPAVPATIASAVAATDRSPNNVKLDAGRKPAQVLQFLGLKRGMQVLDLFGANVYWAEITSPVVGPKGHVTVWQPTQFYGTKGKASFEAFAAKHPNASIITSPFEAAVLPKNYADFVILNDNYHDSYWQNEKLGLPQMDPNAFLKEVYAAMKPGAVIGVIDHDANPNSETRATVEKEHRIAFEQVVRLPRFDFAQNRENIRCRDCMDWLPADRGENVQLQAPQLAFQSLRSPLCFQRLEALARNRLERNDRRALLRLSQHRRVVSCRELPPLCIALLACRCESDLGVRTEGNQFLASLKAILETPEFGAAALHQQVESSAIEQLQWLV